ncbi:hypothetical protein GCM10009069_11910 [Algimonas arctica]|uniref:Transporter n=1 Tax=Algimonas arctica TaxID=1479486 RepID=A0A8J3CRJ2_9PROT|nr:hypothetical protein [Algimonas arctica]GHA90567.1 hypothetical protein GCM10009069_11910 [Algimonas arctica]
MRLSSFILAFTTITALSGLAAPVYAQIASGVPGATVKEGEKFLQYRIAVDVDDDSTGEAAIAQRVLYRQAINDRFNIRGSIQTLRTASSDFDFDYAKLEVTWQITPKSQPYQTGLRLDLRTRANNRSDTIGLNWAHQMTFNDGWRARGALSGTIQFSDKTSDDIAFGGAAQVSRKLENGVRLGVHGFSNFGDSSELLFLKRSSTVAGPFIEFNLTKDVPVMIGTLHGVTNSARDDQIRLFIGKNF